MAALPHTSTNAMKEMPSNSETLVGAQTSADLAQTQSQNAQAEPKGQTGSAASQPMSAEEAAERLYAERMEDEYAKREGGA